MSGYHKLRMAVQRNLCGLHPNDHLSWHIPLTEALYLMTIPVNYSSLGPLFTARDDETRPGSMNAKKRTSSFIRAIETTWVQGCQMS